VSGRSGKCEWGYLSREEDRRKLGGGGVQGWKKKKKLSRATRQREEGDRRSEKRSNRSLSLERKNIYRVPSGGGGESIKEKTLPRTASLAASPRYANITAGPGGQETSLKPLAGGRQKGKRHGKGDEVGPGGRGGKTSVR